MKAISPKNNKCELSGFKHYFTTKTFKYNKKGLFAPREWNQGNSVYYSECVNCGLKKFSAREVTTYTIYGDGTIEDRKVENYVKENFHTEDFPTL